jgi:hypothetical protein
MFAKAKITNPVPVDAASCLDLAKPASLDVVALSAGRPDGVYYAGQRLAPWMAFDERMKLTTWEHKFLCEAHHEDAYRDLKRRRETESIVVRWEIDGGLPSTPVELWDVRDADFDHELRRYAYLWGRESGHTDANRLGHRLLRDAIDFNGRSVNSNAYITLVMELLDALPQDGVWTLPARELVQIVARVDLRQATKLYRKALSEAVEAGIGTAEELAGLGATDPADE